MGVVFAASLDGCGCPPAGLLAAAWGCVAAGATGLGGADTGAEFVAGAGLVAGALSAAGATGLGGADAGVEFFAGALSVAGAAGRLSCLTGCAPVLPESAG